MIRQIAETGKTVPLCDVIRRLVENGAFDKAEREAARAMSEAPHAPEPHNLMGIILENENDHIGAMKHFRAAWALEQDFTPTMTPEARQAHLEGWRCAVACARSWRAPEATGTP